jgi:hypothetical protein
MSLKDLIRAAREELPKPSIVRDLDRFIVARAGLPSPREKGVWHPSEIVQDSFCPRLEVLRRRTKLKQAKRAEVDVEMERIFDVGHAMHHWYQEKYLGPMGLLWGNWRCSRCLTVRTGIMPKDSCEVCQWGDSEDKEGPDLTPDTCARACGEFGAGSSDLVDNRGRFAQPVASRGGCVHCGKWGHWQFVETVVRIPENNILGRADGLLIDENGQPDIVADIKTCNERRFGALSAAGPSEQNVKQVNLYMLGMKKTKGCVLYVCKNDGRVADFRFDYDRSKIEKELADTLLLEKCLADETEPLPDRHDGCISPASKQAKSCVGCDACFAVEN